MTNESYGDAMELLRADHDKVRVTFQEYIELEWSDRSSIIISDRRRLD